MKYYFYRNVIIAILLFQGQAAVHSQNWPCWRGPNRDGSSSETNLPTVWDSVTNVLWKVPVPGVGHASPIVWGDRLFTVTAITESHEKQLLCFDTKNGNLLWKQTVLNTPFEGKHQDNSFASGTPATDGKAVYVTFLDGDSVAVAAYDFNGKLIWIQRPGKFSSPHGYSCSPELYKDKVIINGDSQGDAFIAALSCMDGHIIWKIALDKPAHSFSTPIIRQLSGRMQMIFCGNKEVSSFNPDDGSRYWFVSGPAEDFCSSPVYNEKANLVITSSAWPQRILVAIKPDGNGDVTKSNIVWQLANGGCYVPSPVTVGDYFLSTMTNGLVHCIDAATGNILWKENLGKQYASAVVANGLVYMPNDQGVITVIKPGLTFEVVARNNIGETMFASPAISNGRIYLRSTSNLFCIGLKATSFQK